MIVVAPRYQPPSAESSLPVRGTAEEEYPSPLLFLGKTLNALLLDRVDADIDRLRRITAVLDAGTAVYGPTFVDRVNHVMGNDAAHKLKPIRTVLIRASQDIGRMAGDFVRSPVFTTRASGMVLRILRRLAGSAPDDESDLLSYLLFDGEFARRLMELGRHDARAKEAELAAFFEGMLSSEHEDDEEPERESA
jgi:NTE family protein